MKLLLGTASSKPDCKHTFRLNCAQLFPEFVPAPEVYPELRSNIRRGLMRRFPYSVIYQISADALLILAIAHQHRKPFYWQQGK